MVEYCPISARDQSKLHQCGKKVLPGIFLGYVLIAKGIWKGDILVADIEDLDMMDASDIYPRRIKAKEVLISQKDDEFVETTNSEYPLQGAIKLWGVKISVENFKANRKLLNRQKQKMTLEPRRDFWSMQDDFIYRHHIEPRVQLHVPKEKTCLFHWNTLTWPGPKLLVQIWTCCKKNVFMTIGMWTWIEFCQIHGRSKMGKAAQKKDKQEWANEKPKLDDARKLRDIYFIDPEKIVQHCGHRIHQFPRRCQTFATQHISWSHDIDRCSWWCLGRRSHMLEPTKHTRSKH